MADHDRYYEMQHFFASGLLTFSLALFYEVVARQQTHQAILCFQTEPRLYPCLAGVLGACAVLGVDDGVVAPFQAMATAASLAPLAHMAGEEYDAWLEELMLLQSSAVTGMETCLEVHSTPALKGPFH